jgi:hypothetical protein
MKIKIEAALSEEFLMDPHDSPVQPFEKLVKMYHLADPEYLTTFDKGNIYIDIIYSLFNIEDIGNLLPVISELSFK